MDYLGNKKIVEHNNRFNTDSAIVTQIAEMVLIHSNFGLNWKISC